jgi:hypothetical protein
MSRNERSLGRLADPEQPTKRSRAPVHVSGGVGPSPDEFLRARSMLAASALLPPLRDRLDSHIGRPRSLSVEGLLVSMLVNGLRPHHRGAIVDIARTLNAFTSAQLEAVGIKDWEQVEAYDRVDRLFNKLTKALEHGWGATVGGRQERIDATWFANRIVEASLTGLPVHSRALAVDGTDVETWATLRGDLADDDVDAEYQTDPEGPSGEPARKRRRRAKVLGIGEDGRKIYTADHDARAGHRSAINSRGSGPYVGYELHLGVQTRDLRWTDGIEDARVGDEVPPVIRMLSLVPAGTHRGDAIVPLVVDMKERGIDVNEVVWDRGYSQLRPEHTAHPLRRAGIEQTFRPMTHQRKAKPFRTEAIMIEGQLFSAHLPKELLGPLPMPQMGATVEELERLEQPFNRRARYRYQRLAGPDHDGVTRWKCPFCAGFLRSRSLPKTMRRPRTAPLVDVPQGAKCCGGSMSVSAEDLALWQRLSPGTTAWRISMGRRQVVEGANAGLKGGFVNIERKFFRVLGLVKTSILLAFTVAGYNVDRIRSFVDRMAVEATAPRTRAKRRQGTWTDLLGETHRSAGRDPPAR